MKDEQILDLFFSRDESAIAETDSKYGKYLGKISYNILFDRLDADECVNDTYLNTWNSIPPLRPAVFSSYLGRITRNLSINMYKKKTSEKRGGGMYDIAIEELENTLSAVETHGEEKELLKLINEFLSSLSSEKRVMFVRRYWYMDSVSDIAKRFHCKESRVATMLFRIRESLKEKLLKEGVDI